MSFSNEVKIELPKLTNEQKRLIILEYKAEEARNYYQKRRDTDPKFVEYTRTRNREYATYRRKLINPNGVNRGRPKKEKIEPTEPVEPPKPRGRPRKNYNINCINTDKLNILD